MNRFSSYENKTMVPGNIMPLALIIIFPLLFIWQGLDFTDTGYLLTNYQQIYIEPESIQSSYRIWLTNIIGGLWVFFFGDLLGLLGYKLAGVFLVYGTVGISYLILREYLKTSYLLWGLFISLVFINRSVYQLNYNSLTSFFYILAAYLLLKGLTRNRDLMVFLSAFVLGINVFIRLPNIVGVALVVSLYFYTHINKNQSLVMLRQTGCFASGLLVSAAVIFGAMSLLGHADGYVTAVKGIFGMLNDPEGHHKWDYVFNNFARHHLTAVLYTGMLIAGSFLFLFLISGFGKVRNRLPQYGITISVFFVMVYYYFSYKPDWVNVIISTLGILYIVHFYFLFKPLNVIKNSDAFKVGPVNLRLISFVSLMILLLTPLGSNIAIRNSIFGMYLAIPLVFCFFAGIRDIGRVSRPTVGLVKLLAFILILVITVDSSYYYTYRDSAQRSEMVYKLNHPLLKGVFTTEERARTVNELTDALSGFVKEGDYLLAYEQVSMVYYLTKTKPYLYSSWPMLYGPKDFGEFLERAVKERPYLPVIVRARGSTEDPNWPGSDKLIRSYYHDMDREIINGFIVENKYKVAWRNDFFEILVSGVK